MGLNFADCCLSFLQIKGNTRKPVYCALIRLLQDQDLAVRVCLLWQDLNSLQLMDFVCSLLSFWIIFIISTFCPKIFFPFYSYIVALHQLAACRSLCFLIEDANFHEQDFIEFLPTCWELCFKLIEDVQEFDSKVNSATVLDDL